MSSHGSKIGLFLLTFYLSLAMVTSRSFEPSQDNYYYPRLAGSQMYDESPINPYNQYQEEYYFRDQPLDDSFYRNAPTKNEVFKSTLRSASNRGRNPNPSNQVIYNKRKKGVIIPCAFNAISCFGK